jgi:phytoene dehydrogenase-like protein
MNYDVIVVGGGIAGLTAAAYLSKAGHATLLCEKGSACGGLVNSFERDGFVYDGGIRAMENSGVLFPMLRHLGLEVEFVPNRISLGIEDRVIRVDGEENIVDYQALLSELYPGSRDEIGAIIAQMRRIMHCMKVQYGINNPVFLDMQRDREYMLKAVLPWMLQYALTAPKISALNEPVVDFLKRYTLDQSLLDIITQHFFHQTPAFFALSYLKLYLDYHYPLGGTGKFVEKLVSFITSHQGSIRTDTEIKRVDPQQRVLTDAHGNAYGYRRLIWAADLNTFYQYIDTETIAEEKVKKAVAQQRQAMEGKTGNDSVFTLYLGVDLDKEYFAGKHSEHFFYTPSRLGQSQAGLVPLHAGRETIEKWLAQFFALTTYEIAIPALRDSSLAPEGKTGLIISVLFDYRLTRAIEEAGWYDAFKTLCEDAIIDTLEAAIYPGLRQAIRQRFSATPLTMAKLTGNTQGAITGWAFTNQPMPAENRLPKIMNAIKTPVPGVYQAGQWTYSPSGLPISLLTGKLAADRVSKELGKKRLVSG